MRDDSPAFPRPHHRVLKTAFVDAYLGSLLLQAAFENDAVREQAKSVLVFETVALVAISIGVTTYATDLFTQTLEEEGIDADMVMEDAVCRRYHQGDEDAASASAATGRSFSGLKSTRRTRRTRQRRTSNASNASDAAAKWAAEAFEASATVDESDDAFDRDASEKLKDASAQKKGAAWWGSGEDVGRCRRGDGRRAGTDGGDGRGGGGGVVQR